MARIFRLMFKRQLFRMKRFLPISFFLRLGLVPKAWMPGPSTYGIQVGQNVIIGLPRRLEGAQFIRIGDRSVISANVWLAAYDDRYSLAVPRKHLKPEIVIGQDVYIGNFASITCISRIQIGDGCMFSEFVYISDHVHGFDPEAGLITRQPLVSKGDVIIGAHTFIGYQACVLPGVTLGEHCVVGANSVVTRSFPAFSMVAGAPAHLIKTYSFEKHAWLSVASDS